MKIKLDQHFLESKNILLLEKNLSNIHSDDIIFEIGPGDGRLSEFLLEGKPKKLISIEMDANLKIKLEKIKKKYSNFEYVIGNGLEEIKNFKFNKLISNIPYSITEPLYNLICELKIPFIILLHGNRFFNIILDSNNKWNHFINSFYKIEKILDVPGNAFNPPTKTSSVLIRLILKDEKNLTKEEKLIQILFSKKNRNVNNVLIYSLVDFGLTKKKSREIIKNFNLSNQILSTKFKNINNLEFLNILNKLKSELKIN